MNQVDHTEDPDDIPVESASGAETEVILLESTSPGPALDAACVAHLLDGDAGERAVIIVTLTEPPEQRIQKVREHEDGLPDHVTVIHAREAQADPAGLDGVDLRRIKDPGDLPRLGLVISDALDRYSDLPRTSVCFHSITALMQFVELSRVFRFVYTLGNRVTKNGGRVHLHFDTSAHDQREISTIRNLFDSIFRVPDGRQFSFSENGENAEAGGSDSVPEPWEELFEDSRR